MTLQKRSYTAGHFELLIDGHPTTAYLKSVDGGYVRASVVDEAMGAMNDHIKHMSTVDIEPLSLDFGIAGSNDVLKWIQQSWRKEFSRRSGQINHANFDLQSTFEHEFMDALIVETTFPALDGSSKETAFLKVKLQPERVEQRKARNGKKIQGTMGTKQKLWTASSFRLNIEGIDDMRMANKIESFTIKQGVKKFYTGADRFPQIEPTKLEFPNLSGTISLEYADQLLEWYDRYIRVGDSEKDQRSGSLEFLSPDRKSTLFRINLDEIGMHHLQVLQSQANQDSIKRVKFELFVGRMDIDGGGALGMES